MLTELLPAKTHSEVSGSGFRTCTTSLYTRHVNPTKPCYHYHVHSCPFHFPQLQCSSAARRHITLDKHWVPAGDKPLTKGSAYRCSRSPVEKYPGQNCKLGCTELPPDKPDQQASGEGDSAQHNISSDDHTYSSAEDVEVAEGAEGQAGEVQTDFTTEHMSNAEIPNDMDHTDHSSPCDDTHDQGHQVFGKEIQTPLTQPDHYLAHATVDPEEQSWIVSSRYMRPYVRKPEEHDGFWHAQTAECIASPKAKDQTLGSLASKYGLGTQYDPFRSSALEQCLGKPAT